MKIALISPKGRLFSNEPRLLQFWENAKVKNGSKLLSPHFSLWAGFNLGLLVIAALTPKRFHVELIDENLNLNGIDFEKYYDLVAITTITQQATRAYEIADEFRKRGCKVIIGGIHATIIPHEAKMHADSVVIGEGEGLWPQLLNDFLDNKIKPFYSTRNLFNLRKSPIPRYDLLNPKDYKVIWLQASRGCPFDCEFCAASKIFGIKFRHKTIEQVIKEIKVIKKIWKNPQINFSDDNMFIDRKYVVELIKRLIPLKIRWAASTDISVAKDESFLKLLRKAGCMILFIGFESLSKKGLSTIDRYGWKCKQLDNYAAYVEKIQSYGIGVQGAFILGLDSDDASVFKKTSDFIVNNNFYAAQITVLTPLPGTRLRERLDREKRLLPEGNWDRYSFLDVNFIPKRMSSKDLQDGILKVYQEVYSKENRFKIASHFKKIYTNLSGII